MTTPTSALGLSHIQTEFGGSNPIAISEYYGVNANVPASGTIKMSQFLGISSVAARVDPATVDIYGNYSANSASVHWANGTWQGVTQGDTINTLTSPYPWLGSGAASAYEILAKRTGGTSIPTFSTGWANNTWAACSSDRKFWIRSSAAGILTSDVEVSIRYAANSVVIDTATHSLRIDVYK